MTQAMIVSVQNFCTVKCEYSFRLLQGKKDKGYVFENELFCLSIILFERQVAVKLKWESNEAFYILPQEVYCDLDFTRLFTDSSFNETVQKKVQLFQTTRNTGFYGIDISRKQQDRKQIVDMFAVQKQIDTARKSGGIKKNSSHSKSPQNNDLDFTFSQPSPMVPSPEIDQVIIQISSNDKIEPTVSTTKSKANQLQKSMFQNIENDSKKIQELIQEDISEVRKFQAEFLKVPDSNTNSNDIKTHQIKPNVQSSNKTDLNLQQYDIKKRIITFIQKNKIQIVGLSGILFVFYISYITSETSVTTDEPEIQFDFI